MRDGEAWGKGMVISPAAKTREGFLEEVTLPTGLSERQKPREYRKGI